MRGFLGITAEQAVARALRASRHPITYKLGQGGFDPRRPLPDDAQGECDCSGAVAFFLGIPRDQTGHDPQGRPWFPGGWIETSRVYRDATKTHVGFRMVTHCRSGDVIVYPDAKGRQGHIGIITQAGPDGLPEMVCHCTARPGVPSAVINEPYGTFWRGAVKSKGAIFARPTFLKP